MRKLLYSLFLLVASANLAACMPSRESEAKNELARYLRDYEKITECGDSSYIHFRGPNLVSYGKFEEIFQLREPILEVQGRDLSEADKLNGLEFDGTGVLKAAASRTASAREGEAPCWNKWESRSLGFVIRRENGKWHVEHNGVLAGEEFLDINCEELLKLPTCP